MLSSLHRLIVLTSLGLLGTGVGADASIEGLEISVQPDAIRYHGTVPDVFTAIGLHQITHLAAPESRCLDDVSISPTAPSILQPRLLAGLLSELSVSTDAATVSVSGHQLTLATRTTSRVTEIAIVTRLAQLEKVGFEIDNQLEFIEDGETVETPEPAIQFSKKVATTRPRPAFDEAFLIAESERQTMELAESLVAEATPAPIVVATPVALEAEPEPEPEIEKSPRPRGVTFPPETFVLTGRLRTRVSDFAEEIFGRDDLGPESVTLRITLSADDGASFSRWMAEEQLESVKLGLIGRGVDADILLTEIVQPEDEADRFENHIAILLPPLPAIAEADPQGEETTVLLPAQEMSSLAIPAITP